MTYYNGNRLKKPDVPSDIQKKWQNIVDLMAKVMEAPAALIKKIDPPQIEVFIASESKRNPYKKGERAHLNTGLYGETVIKRRTPLLVPDALENPEWNHNPDIKLGMSYYYGFPLEWPDGEIFGTISVLDYKDNSRATAYCDLISEFKQVIEGDLHLILEITERKLIEKNLEKVHNELEILNLQLEDRVLKRTKELEDANRQLQEEILIRKRAEKDLKESEQKFRDIVRNIPGVVYQLHVRKDKTSYFSYISPYAPRLFGFSTDPDSPEWKMGAWVHPDDREQFMKSFNQTVVNRTSWNYEGRIVTAKGVKWFRTISTPTIAEDEIIFNGVLLDVTDRKKAEEKVKHLFLVLSAIRNINQLIIREKDRNLLSQKACDILNRVRGYNTAWIGLLKDEKSFDTVVGSPNRKVSPFCAKVLRGDHPPCIKKALTKKALFMFMDRSLDCGDCSFIKLHLCRNSLLMRITYNGKHFGFLVISIESDKYIDEEEKELLEEVTSDIAFGLHSIELQEKHKQAEKELKQSYEKLQKTMEDTIYIIGKIAETRDPYTSGHQKKVSQLSTSIAQEMKLPRDRTEAVRIASLVHDIGKISIPAEILSKPTRLSPIEIHLIKDHPKTGYNILSSVEFPWPIAQIVLQHHERIDGSGYPDKIKADKILPEAKIIGVADVVEAMSSHRPYRPALGIDKALEEISLNKGALYDPQVVDTCFRLFKKKGFKFH